MKALAATPKYEAYKDSGVKWLGKIPESWDILPGKRFHRVVKIPNSNKLCSDVLSLTLRGVVNNDPENPEGLIPKDYGTYQFFEKDNLVFKLIDLENLRTSRVGLVHQRGIMSPAYIRLIAGSDFDPKYLYYYYYDLYLNSVYNNLGEGVRSTLTPTDLLLIPSIKPKSEEQTTIANFLDQKTSQIDQAIAIKEKQITLLKERKQILIQNAVTHGLNPDVHMRNSGVEWIGEIPEHWRIRRLASFGFFSKGGGFSKSDLTENGISAVLYGDIYTKYEYVIDSVERNISPVVANNSVKLHRGDLLFTGSGETKEDIGKCVVFDSNEEAVAGGDVIIFKQKENNKLFLSYCLNTHGIILQKAKSSKGEIIVHTYASKLRELYIPIPPIDEQAGIAHYITKELSKIDKAITLQQQQIEKLKEYKTTLINSAVTGKIKVIDQNIEGL